MANKGIFIAENMASTTVGSLLRSGVAHKDLENGNVVKLGALVTGESDLYTLADIAAVANEVYIVDAVELDADEQLTKGLQDYSIKEGDVIRLRKAQKGDRFSISETSITALADDKVVIGNVVEIPATGVKLVEKVSATSGASLVCKIVEVWNFSSNAIPMVRLEVQ